MRYYKIVSEDYVTAIGIGPGGTELTEQEYCALLAHIRSRPQEEGKGYRLRADLSWEEYDLPQEDADDEEISDEEALRILLGGAV